MAIYRTAKGKAIDMTKFISQHELTPAVGNMKVNARGDELKPRLRELKQREIKINTISKKPGMPSQRIIRSQKHEDTVAVASVVTEFVKIETPIETKTVGEKITFKKSNTKTEPTAELKPKTTENLTIEGES